MSRFAVVDADGTVVSVVEWDGESDWRPPEGMTAIGDPDGLANIGGRWENGAFMPPPQPEPPPDPEPSFPPLSPRQIRLGLLHAGITGQMVTEALAGNEEGLIEWQYATRFERDHPLIEALAGSFGLTSEQIDEMWLAALEL